MTTNIEFDAVSNSWDEHTSAAENHISTGVQVAQATAGQAASEPVPVDVGSGAPAQGAANAPAANQPAANAPAANAPASNAAQGNAPAGNAPAANAAAANVPHEYHAEAGNVVKLPANVSIDNIKVDGHNLVLVQPDGSEIVIKDGALNVPTFILGDVEVPRVALIAALEASHVDVAFGADGSISAGGNGSPSSAGGNFEQPAGGIGDGFGLTALLPPTALQFGQPEHRELFPGLVRENSIPTIIDLTPSTSGGDTTVDEKGLETAGATGSGETGTLPGVDNDTSEHNTGAFTINSPDGIGSVNINGQVISGAELANSGSTPIDITTPLGNTLTINGYDPATGQVSYTYTLLHAEQHPAGDGPIFDNMTVTVTDSDGDVSLPGTLSVNIVDDVPTAHDDTATQATENAPVTVNVFANDVPGADGVNIADPTKVSYVANSLTGGTGTVTYNNDGTFTYKPAAGEEGTVTFQYRIVDGDGDASVATVTINLKPDSTPTIGVTPQNPDANGHSAASEAGLPPHDGLPAGSGETADNDPNNNSDASETTTGALAITTGGDTIGHLYVTDKDNTQIEITNAPGGILVHGQYGDLTITGTPATGYTYSYTLLDNTVGNGTHDDFAMQVVDSDGDPASTTLTIDIVNDVPHAVNDSATQAAENVPVTVDVFANDVPGADGVNIADPAKVSYVANSLSGGTGTVTYNNDGTFTYTPAAGEEGTVTFQYQILDGDGDASVATVTINLLKDSTPTIDVTPDNPDASGNSAANEAGLPPHDGLPAGSAEIADGNGANNSDTSETTTGALTITTGSDTIGHLYLTDKDNNQIEVTNGGMVHGQYGDLTITGTPATGYTYSYTLLDSTSGNGTHDDFAVQVVDSDGDPASTTLTINIVNDVPTAHDDTDAAQSGETVTGNVEAGTSTNGVGAADTAGADGIASIAWTGAVANNGVTTVTGAHGVLTVYANGDYSYQATPNTPTGTDVFNYTITDGDGDTSPATLTIEVTGSQPRVVAEVAAVNEAGIDTTPPPGDLGPGTVDGSHAGDGSETTTGKLTFSDPDNPTVTGVQAGDIGSDVSGNVGTNINGTYGILHVDADGTYTYTLTKPEANVPAGNDGANVQPGQDVFTFTVTDSFGNTSTSTIKINITDDVPTISNAVVGSSVTLDETNNGPTTNGVLNPAIMTATSAAAIVTLTSNYGADGAGTTTYALSVTNAASGLATAQGDHPITLVQVGNTIEGQYNDGSTHTAFTVSIGADGKLTVVQNVALEHLVDGGPAAYNDALNLDGKIAVTATVTDADGDTASTGVINIGGAVTFLDDGPSISNAVVGSSVTLDETNNGPTTNGVLNPAIMTATSAAAIVTLTSNYGADGAGTTTYALSVTNAASGLATAQGDHAITLVQVGNTIEGQYNDGSTHTAFTVSIGADGKLTVVQNVALEHLVDGGPAAYNDALNLDGKIAVTATVTDADGDTASTGVINIGGAVTFLDDGPSISNAVVGSSVTLDETNNGPTTNGVLNPAIMTATSAAAIVTLTSNYGADSAGTTTYALSVTNAASGLATAQGDHAITLVQVGNTIEGQYNDGSTHTAFTVSIGADGKLTVVQNVALEHLVDGGPAAYNDALNLDGKIAVTATVTDADGDTASTGVINIGGAVTFLDDGPSISNAVVGSSVTLDETNNGPTTNGVLNPAIMTATSAAAIVTLTSNYGADGAGTTTYALSVTNAASGLATAQGDHAITLVQVGNTIEGQYNDGSTHTAFTVSIGADGKLTVVQNVALEHLVDGGPAAYNDALNLDGKIAVTATVTDADGDTASTGAINIGGAVTFLDDGPSISNAVVGSSVTLDETNNGPTTNGVLNPAIMTATSAAAIVTLTSNYGADGAGTTTYALSVTNAASGLATAQGDHAITLVQVGNTIEGQYNDGSTHTAFTVSIGADGKLTVVQNVALEHLVDGGPAAYNDALNLDGKIAVTATVTDADGDTASTGAINIGGAVTFLDDGPSISNAVVGSSVTLDETNNGPTTNGVLNPAIMTATSAAAIVTLTSNYGADGAGTTTYALSVTNAASGLATAQGDHAITLVQVGNTIEGQYNDGSTHTAFTVSIGADGKLTVVQNVALEHLIDGGPAAYNDALNLDGKIAVTATVTDADGDTASSGAINIGGAVTFLDDGPSISNAVVGSSVTLDETNNGPTTDGILTNTAAMTVTSAAAIVTLTSNYGADGAGTTTYALSVTNATSGLATAQGDHPITLVQVGNTIQGQYNDGSTHTAFTVSIGADGKLTVVQNVALEHLIDGGPAAYNDALNLDGKIAVTATVTDADGDTASSGAINIGGAVTFLDDGPSMALSGTSFSLTVDESNLAINDSKSFAGAFTPSFGADGAGTVTYTLGFNAGATGLTDTATGQAVVLSLEGGQVVGRAGAGGAIVFTVSADASGNVTLDQQRAVVHPNTSNPDDNVTLSAASLVTLTATVTDADGDTASQTLNIGNSLNFHDDGPTLGSFTPGTIPNEVGAVSGLFSISAGADGLDHFNITGPVIAGIIYTTSHTADGTTVLHAMSGATEVFDLTVRPDGTYEFDLITPQAATSVTQTLTGLSAGGPTPFLETPDGLVEFTGNGNGVNSSTQGFGVSDQFVENGENFTMEFHTSGTPGNDAPTLNPRYISALDFTAGNNSSGSVHWTATNTGTGQTENGTATLTNGHLIIDPSIDFNVISITGDPGSKLRLESVGISQTILPSDSNYHFQVSAVDKDGDVSAIQGLDIHQVAAGSGGNYTLNGFAGTVNDVIAGSTHTDTIAGGAGTDIADYTGSVAAVSIHLADDGHASGAPGTFNNPAAGTIGGGDAIGDTLTGIEGLIGGSGNDFLFGNASDNYLAGGAGDDTINGGGGNDTLVGGLGQDTLTGGAGADTFKLDHIDIKDLITDYNGGEGDVIDLTSLFKTGSENIGDYVNYNQATGTLSVDVNGSTGGANFVDVAQLTNLPAANTITLLYDDGAHTHTTTANVV